MNRCGRNNAKKPERPVVGKSCAHCVNKRLTKPLGKS